jgi:hypothetical protein
MRQPWSCWTRTTRSSTRPSLVRPALAIYALAGLGLWACAPSGLYPNRLDAAVGAAIGDPSTCLLLADARTGKVVYQYGDAFNCSRALPACDAPGTLNARAALQFASRPGGRLASCPSSADGSRTVGWAAEPVQSAKQHLVYSAVMEGQRALPGHEMNARLYDAFQKAGL